MYKVCVSYCFKSLPVCLHVIVTVFKSIARKAIHPRPSFILGPPLQCPVTMLTILNYVQPPRYMLEHNFSRRHTTPSRCLLLFLLLPPFLFGQGLQYLTIWGLERVSGGKATLFNKWFYVFTGKQFIPETAQRGS